MNFMYRFTQRRIYEWLIWDGYSDQCQDDLVDIGIIFG